jgi:hypothetical protein
MANRTSESLAEFREKITEGQTDWQLRGGLILYKNRLLVHEDGHLRTELNQEARKQLSLAHPGRNKTCQLIGAR